MGKQEDFVLRALEERDVRFVRLWFTDVLGFLKSVAIRAGGAPGRLRWGHRLRRLRDRGVRARLRGRHARQADPATFQTCPGAAATGPSTARMFCDI
jgi:glutamine synthetase